MKSSEGASLSGRDNMRGEYPGLRSQTRSSQGYKLAGLQPLGGALRA